MKYAKKELDTLWDEVKRLENPHEYYVDLTDKLRALKQELIKEHTEELDKPAVLKKEYK